MFTIATDNNRSTEDKKRSDSQVEEKKGFTEVWTRTLLTGKNINCELARPFQFMTFRTIDADERIIPLLPNVPVGITN